MITKNRCKKIVSLIISLSLLTLCLLNFSGCRLLSNEDNEDNEDDESKEVVIDIITQPYDNQNNNADIFYYSFYTNEKVNEIEPFTPDEMEVFYVPYGCFDSYSQYKPRGVDNPIKDIKSLRLEDANGNDVEITPIISSILEEVQKIEHPIINMKIFKDNEEYFVFISLNVNWWSPCRLYYYNQDYSKLVELYTFNREEVTGIRIRDLSRYKWHYIY
ncbi:MAG: hypothetical protein J1E85_01685 [Ruminococcus sp.]|nr:hypothetical protein [Ruminococcus sp.]